MLGCILQAESAIPAVLECLEVEDFYHPSNREVFAIMLDMHMRSVPVDPVTMLGELDRRQMLGRVSGTDLHTMIQSAPLASNAAHYAQRVAEKARLRRLAELGARFQQIAYSNGEVDEGLAVAEQYFRSLQKPDSSGSMAGDLFQQWLEWEDSKEDIISTPWPELNEYLGGGLRKGKMYVIAGRPGSGKSLGGLNIGAHIAECGRPVTVFSLEMRKMEVTSRLLASGAWASYGEIFRKQMKSETRERVQKYIANFQAMNLEVVDRASMTVEQIVAHIRAKRPEAVFVDYCQLITASFRGDRREAIDHITRSLKVCAADNDVALVLASQVNRNGDGKMPTIADLRESGSIENDADVVMLLHREDEGAGTVKMNVGKNRDGKQGIIEMLWRGDIARIG